MVAETNVILATAGYDRTVRLWDCNTQSTYRTLQFTESQVNDVCFSTDNELLLVGGNPRAAVFNVSSSNPNPSYVFDAHRGNITELGCHPRGEWMFSASDDGTVKTWDTRSPEAHRSFSHHCPVNCVAIDSEGNWLYSGDQNGRLRVWDVRASKMATELQPQAQESVETVALSANGDILVAANYVGACYFWAAHQRHILRVAFDHETIPTFAAGLDTGAVKLWKADKLKVETEGGMPFIDTMENHTRWVWDLEFTADSRRIFTASSDMKALLVDVKTGSVLKTFEGHQKAITCLSIAEVPG